MAKYQVTHICGHDQEHILFGPGKERDRKISWFESQDCATCWSKAKRVEQDAQPLTATLIYNAFSGGVWLAITTGNTYAIKDQLKTQGFCWREYQDNADILGCKVPKKAWMLRIADGSKDPNFQTAVTAAQVKFASLGITGINMDKSLFAQMSYVVAGRQEAHNA